MIAYGCLIKRKEACREHLHYIYKGVMCQLVEQLFQFIKKGKND